MGTAAIITAVASLVSVLGGLFAKKKISERKARKEAACVAVPPPPPPIGEKPH